MALKLLERYFQIDRNAVDAAQAHFDRATAMIELGRSADAMAAYECALACEATLPSVLTQAYVALPYFIATTKARPHYDRALALLLNHRDRLTFPIEHFRWNAARALIAADNGQSDVAKQHAIAALEAAERQHSGFRLHPAVGLVSDEYQGVIEQLRRLSDG